MQLHIQEELKDAMFKHPLVLLSVKSSDSIAYINSFLPFSVGFEIECDKGDYFDIDHFRSIPNIMDINCDSSEQRFRIPPGIKGFICLWHISEALKINSLLNNGSGIHYHIDCTPYYRYFNDKNVRSNEKWMLKELDAWKYKGSYNSRMVSFNTCHQWIRFQPQFKTMEFRIGEMTFDYDVLIKRMVSASAIVRQFITNIGYGVKELPVERIKDPMNLARWAYNKSHTNNISNLQSKLKQLSEKPIEVEDNIEEIVRNRIIRNGRV